MSDVLPPGPWLPLSAAVGLSYLLGALPFGLLLTKGLKGIDLREVGSGNIGATNTMRVLGRGWGLVAFALDFGKGWFPVTVLARHPGGGDALAQLLCGAGAVLGHCFPVYLGFKGGKGVATGFGAIVGVDLSVGVAAGLVWLVTLQLTHFVGLASVLMGLCFPVVMWLRHPEPKSRPLVVGAALLTVLILVRHRANISRMLAGTEPKSGRNGRL